MKELLISNHESMPPATFSVSEVSEKEGNIVHADEVKTVFLGESGLADLLFGWGIARWLITTKDKVALLLFNSDDKPEFPDNTNLLGGEE